MDPYLSDYCDSDSDSSVDSSILEEWGYEDDRDDTDMTVGLYHTVMAYLATQGKILNRCSYDTFYDYVTDDHNGSFQLLDEEYTSQEILCKDAWLAKHADAINYVAVLVSRAGKSVGADFGDFVYEHSSRPRDFKPTLL